MTKIESPIFIGGCPRSGTTLLHLMIAAHPELAYPDIGINGMIYHRWIKYFDRIAMPAVLLRRFHRIFLPANKDVIKYDRRFDYLDLFPRLPKEGWFIWQDILSKAGFMKEDLSQEFAYKYETLISRACKRYQVLMEIFGKKRFVDKFPDYLAYWSFLKTIFPDAYMINIVRDGRAVVNSHAYIFKYRKNPDGTSWIRPGVKWFGKAPPNREELKELPVVERVCHQWNYFIDLGQEVSTNWGDRFYTIKYEDLIMNTKVEIQKIYAFCQLAPWGENILPEKSENRNKKVQAKSGTEFQEEIWTKKNSVEENEYKFFEIMRPNLEAMGYVEKGAPLI